MNIRAVRAVRSSSPSSSSLARRAWRLRRTKIGTVIVLPVVLLALIGPRFAGPTTKFMARPFAKPSVLPPLGADVLGRDVWWRFLAGGQSTLLVAAVATLIGVGVGTALGLATVVSRSWLGAALARIMDLILVFPLYVLVLLFVSVLGSSSLALVIAIAFIPIVGRVVRAAALEVSKREHVQYARSVGASRWQIIRHEILPNVTGPISVEFGLRLTFAIALVAALSYLGFGAPPPEPDWGAMISENQVGIKIQPWGVFAPVVAIAVLTIGTNLIAEGFAAASAARASQTSSAPQTMSTPDPSDDVDPESGERLTGEVFR